MPENTDAAEAAVDAYVAAWNTSDAAERDALLTAALADDATFAGPTGIFVGRPAIAGLIVALRERMTDATVERTGPLSGEDGRCVFGWKVRRPDGSTILGGVDEVELSADSRLSGIRVAI